MIVRATQFFEFVGAFADSGAEGNSVRLLPAMMQLFVSDDEEPHMETTDLAGPEPIRMDDLVRSYSLAPQDSRQVTTDSQARYFGTEVNDQSLTPGKSPRIGSTRFMDWLSHATSRVSGTPPKTLLLNTTASHVNKLILVMSDRTALFIDYFTSTTILWILPVNFVSVGP